MTLYNVLKKTNRLFEKVFRWFGLGLVLRGKNND